MTSQSFDWDRFEAITPYKQHRREVAQELAAELPRRASARSRILARLEQGPATNVELSAIALRFGARLKELRDDGHIICTVPLAGGLVRYSLHD